MDPEEEFNPERNPRLEGAEEYLSKKRGCCLSAALVFFFPGAALTLCVRAGANRVRNLGL